MRFQLSAGHIGGLYGDTAMVVWSAAQRVSGGVIVEIVARGSSKGSSEDPGQNWKMKIPPLNSLRAFEAAGRRLSFKLAAEELFVAPSAVSRHIAILEEALGVVLFKRDNRQIRLTRLGAAYFRAISSAFRDMETASQEITSRAKNDPLRIWCPMTFGMRWLVPRLPKFRQLHPDREVVFSTSLGNDGVDVEATDVAIRIGKGSWPGATAHRLVGIEVVPVCSPDYAAKHHLQKPQDLVRAALLQSSTRSGYWRAWLATAGVSRIDPDKAMTFESVSLAYQLAIDGAGVALGQHALVASDLASGKLITPFPLAIRFDDAFWLVYSGHLDGDPFVRSFRDWLVRESAEFEANRFAAGGISAMLTPESLATPLNASLF